MRKCCAHGPNTPPSLLSHDLTIHKLLWLTCGQDYNRVLLPNLAGPGDQYLTSQLRARSYQAHVRVGHQPQ